MPRHSSLPGLAVASLGLLFAPGLTAQEGAAAALETVKALEQEFDQASTQWMQDYRAASKEERQALMTKRPQAKQWFGRFWKLVESAPASDAGLASATWIVTRSAATGPDLERTLGILLEHHAEKPELAKVCGSLSRNPSLVVNKFLRQVEKQSPHDEVKAQACFNLAQAMKSQANLVNTIKTADDKMKKSIVDFYGRETIDVLMNANVKTLQLEAEGLYDKILKTPAYADVKFRRGTLGREAKNNLFEMRNLAIGKAAPEIVGEDIDGNPMKLSDYRGKVVVIDFWGDW